jgi:hypothetical protein
MSQHANRVQMTLSSGAGNPGTSSPLTLGSATAGYQSFASAYGGNATVDILITENTSWEVCRNCTYTNSGTTVSRTTPEASSAGGAAVSFTSAAIVSVIATAGFGNDLESVLGILGIDPAPISVTGATTATLGRLHVCTGTSADYTVTLPAVSGNSGKYVAFIMGDSTALTRFVTLDGNASETIDGETTRIMWSGETAILRCNGTEWIKIAGKTKALVGVAAPSADATVTPSTNVQINLNTSVIDNSGRMVETGSNQIRVKRTGLYNCLPVFRLNNVVTARARAYGGMWRTRSGVTTQWVVLGEAYAAAGGYPTINVSCPVNCNADDLLLLYCGMGGTGNETLDGTGSTEGSYLSVQEVPSW